MTFLAAPVVLFGFATTVGKVMAGIMLVGSMAHQMQQSRKMRKAAKDAAEARKGFEFVTEGEAVDLPIVYGFAKIGGARVFRGVSSSFNFTESSADKTFNVGIQAGDSVALTNRYWDSESGDWVETTEEVETNASGMLDRSHTGSKNEFLMFQQALCQGPINACHEMVIDEDRFLDDPTLGNAVFKRGRFDRVKAALRADVFFGKGAQPDRLMAANFGERHSAKFTDIAYSSVYIRLDRDDPQFSGSIPAAQFLIEGKLVRRVVNGALQNERVFSNNPAWCLLDYLLTQADLTVESCVGLPPGLLDLKSFEEAAAICDRVVAQNKPVGGKFWQPTDQSRKIVERDIKLYECNLIIDTRQPFRENISKILSTMGDARLRWSQGKYYLHVVYPEDNESIPNTVYITDDDLVPESEVLVARPSMSSKLNNCTIRYHDASMEFRENSVSWPPKKDTINFRGIGGFRYPSAPSAEWSGDHLKIMPTYAVWSGVTGNTTLSWKFAVYEGGVYELNFAAKDSGTISITGPGVGISQSVSGNSILKTNVTLTEMSVYSVEISASSGHEDKGVAAFLRHTTLQTQAWSTTDPAFTNIEVQTRSAAIHQVMLGEDNWIELEEDIFFDGCTDYYHALAKAEEMVRTSRSASEINFSIILKDKIPETGDFVSISSQALSLGLTTPFIVRINEVQIRENGICNIKGARFDWTQLAWNVDDNEYLRPPPIYDFRVLPPFNVQYIQDVNGIYYQSSGKVTWEHPDPEFIQRYIVYILTHEDIVDGKANWRELGTSNTLEYQLPALNPDRSYMFGVRAMGLNGVLSVMATTGDIGFDMFDPINLPVDIPLNLAAEGNHQGIRLIVTLQGGQPLFGRKLQFIRGTSDDIEEATFLTEISDYVFFDTDLEYDTNYYYWVRLVNHTRVEDKFGEWFGPEMASRSAIIGDPTVPTPVTNFTGLAFFDRIMLTWDPPVYGNHGYTEIWSAAVPELASAELLGRSHSTSYVDFPGELVTRHYYARFVSTSNVKGPYSGPLTLTTERVISRVLDELEGEILDSHLHETLRTPIELIEKPGDGLLARTLELETKLDVIESQLADISGLPEYDVDTSVSEGDVVKFSGKLYLAKMDMSAPVPIPTNETYWVLIGEYSSFGEAMAAHAIALSQHDTRLTELDAVAYDYSILKAAVQHPTTGLNATAQRVTGTEASIVSLDNDITATAQSLSNLSAVVNHASTGLSTKASVNYVDGVIATEGQARAISIQQIAVRSGAGNLFHDANLERTIAGVFSDFWSGPANFHVQNGPPRFMQWVGTSGSHILSQLVPELNGTVNQHKYIPVIKGDLFTASASVHRNTSAYVGIGLGVYDNNGNWLEGLFTPPPTLTGIWEDVENTLEVTHTNAAWALPFYHVSATGTSSKTLGVRAPLISRGASVKSVVEVKADVTAISAEYFVKVNSGNMITGFGIHSGAGISSFGVLADMFWVGGPGDSASASPPTGKVPFIVRNSAGTWGPAGVYMRSAFFEDASIDYAKIIKGDIFDLTVLNKIESLPFNTSHGFQLNRDGSAVFRGNVLIGGVPAETIGTSIALIRNLDFELGPPSSVPLFWQGIASNANIHVPATSTYHQRSGFYCLAAGAGSFTGGSSCTAEASKVARSTDSIPIIPGYRYIFGGYIRGPATPSSNFRAYWGIEFRNAAGTLLSTFRAELLTSQSDNTWKPVHNAVFAPANAVTATAVVGFCNNNNGSWVFWDDGYLHNDYEGLGYLKSQLQGFRYPGSPMGQTWIDGGSIHADKAFIGTLYIAGRAVTQPVSGYVDGAATLSSSWVNLVSTAVLTASGLSEAPIIIMANVLLNKPHGDVAFRVIDNTGAVHYQENAHDGTQFSCMFTVTNPGVVSRTYTLQASTGLSLRSARKRAILALEVKR